MIASFYKLTCFEKYIALGILDLGILALTIDIDPAHDDHVKLPPRVTTGMCPRCTFKCHQSKGCTGLGLRPAVKIKKTCLTFNILVNCLTST